ncbi:MAG: DUF1003 domain-containing protein [Bacteroidetes bacterium]|nr:DUF1003 domain-containing protein [Bacteroidota bacterium]
MKDSNKSKFVCQVCKKEISLSELMPGFSVRESIVDLIKNSGCEWNPKGYICINDLNNFRNQFVQKIVQDDNGNISSIEKEVLNSIADKDILSKNISEEMERNLSFGERLADGIAKFGGSWSFISIFGIFLFFWMIINIFLITVHPFDPYPFILLNLILSCLAAIQAPIIMMSQNRQEDKDRQRALHDYQVNLKAELEIRLLNDKVDHLLLQQGQRMMEIQQIQIELMEEISNRMKK